MVATIAGQQRILRREGVMMLAAMTLFTALIWDGSLNRPDGILLIIGMAVASFYLVRWSRQDDVAGFGPDLDEIDTDATVSAGKEIAIGILTLIAMLIGAELLKDGALDIAEIMGISAGVIGLTLVAIGTSLPELATAVAAARRRENGLVVGNLLGSNLFNSLIVGGGVALFRPGTLEQDFTFTLITMMAIGAGAGILGTWGNRYVRAEGAALLAVYFIYLFVTF